MVGTNITDMVYIQKIETVFYNVRLRFLLLDITKQEAGWVQIENWTALCID